MSRVVVVRVERSDSVMTSLGWGGKGGSVITEKQIFLFLTFVLFLLSLANRGDPFFCQHKMFHHHHPPGPVGISFFSKF